MAETQLKGRVQGRLAFWAHGERQVGAGATHPSLGATSGLSHNPNPAPTRPTGSTAPLPLHTVLSKGVLCFLCLCTGGCTLPADPTVVMETLHYWVERCSPTECCCMLGCQHRFATSSGDSVAVYSTPRLAGGGERDCSGL